MPVFEFREFIKERISSFFICCRMRHIPISCNDIYTCAICFCFIQETIQGLAATSTFSIFAMTESTTSKDDIHGRVPGDADSGSQTVPPRPKPAGGRPVCGGCGRPIADRFLLYAMDRHWHVGCLRCSVCQMPLDDAVATCYTRAGLILCRTDYLRLVFHSVCLRFLLIDL